MTDALLRLPEVKARCGLSRSTIYDRMAEGRFPKTVSLGVNSVAWRESELAEWMRAPMDWRAAA